MNIKLIRHATLLLKVTDKTLLVDPMLSTKGTLSAIKNVPNKNNNPLVDLPVPIDYITNCDAVLITHTHRDHFDAAAANAIPKDKLIFCQPQDEEKINTLALLTAALIFRTFLIIFSFARSLTTICHIIKLNHQYFVMFNYYELIISIISNN